MQKYETRNIHFKDLIEINGWKVKIYTISKSNEFDHPKFHQHVLTELPLWLSMKNSFNSTDLKTAFLILHSGTEGIFSLINWWVGENMLNTHIFLTNPIKPSEFRRITGDGLAHGIWELEIISHESNAWTNHVLKKEINPDFNAYLKDVLNKIH